MKSMKNIHHELFQNRERATRATHTWGTYRINKNGATSKLATTTHTTQAEAEANVIKLMDMNAGATYVAHEL